MHRSPNGLANNWSNDESVEGYGQSAMPLQADFFGERQRMQEAEITRLWEKKDWTWASGDYSSKSLDMVNLGEGRTAVPHEQFVSDLIWQQLEENPDRPVVALDVGGGLGVSWSRLSLEFKLPIERGQVAFVVSNLNNDGRRDLQRTDADRKPLDSQTLNMLEYAESHQLVHYVGGTFAQLGNATITLPGGHSMRLQNNVTIMHESRSLTAWSKVPEVDIPRAAEVLAPGGVYMVPGNDMLELQAAQSSREMHARQAGITLAHKALQEKGLMPQEWATRGRYAGNHLNWMIFSDSRSQSGALI